MSRLHRKDDMTPTVTIQKKSEMVTYFRKFYTQTEITQKKSAWDIYDMIKGGVES